MKPNEEELKSIEEERVELEGVFESLNKQLERGESRFKTEEQRARTLTAEIVGTRRNEEKVALASDEALSHKMRDLKLDELVDIDKLLDNPYFARVVVEEEINGKLRQISYKLGLRSNTECRIIDWRRAPIAKLYYEYREGDEYFEEIQGKDREGTILTRNKVRIKDGRLEEVTNKLGTFAFVEGEWIKSQAGGSRGNAGRMPDVLSLITPEQFKSITEDAENAVLIQGIAGSGKTTVALHRLAWLMHEDNTDYGPSDVAVILRSPVLRKYIEASLETLEISGVPVLTWKQWREKVLGAVVGIKPQDIPRPQQKTPFSVRRVKYSTGVLKALEQHVKGQSLWVLRHFNQTFRLNELPELVKTMIDEQEILEEPVLVFLRKLKALIKDASRNPGGYPAAFSDALEEIERITPALQKYQHDLVEILKNQDCILENDETTLLDKKVISDARNWATQCLENKQFDFTDDPLIIRLHQLKSGKFLNHKGSDARYKHIVIDELQDFGAVELAPLVSSAEKRENLTLSGDSAQDIREDSNFTGWQRLQKIWGLDASNARYVELKVSHRSTVEIMRFADNVLGKNRNIEGRNGKPPLWHKCLSEDSGVSKILNWLELAVEKFPDAITAVLCANREDARFAHSLLEPTFGPILRYGDRNDFTFEEGIVVTEIGTVKGLEFKSVLLWNPSSNSFPNNSRAKSMLYVGATRAEDNLCIVSWDKPSRLLPGINSKLVRGIEEEVEVEDRSPGLRFNN